MKAVLRSTMLFAALAGGGCSSLLSVSQNRTVEVQFSPGDAGRVPTAFSTALTGGGGDVAWAVRSDTTATGGAALVQESSDETSYRFPLCIYDPLTLADVSATVKFKAIRGNVDQAAGIVLRYTPENYYVARANALEDNINLFKTVNGKRIKIAEIETKVTPAVWHTLGFIAVGPHLVVTFDGKTVIELDDPTFSQPGKVGLWTKADSVTAFADLRINPRGDR